MEKLLKTLRIPLVIITNTICLLLVSCAILIFAGRKINSDPRNGVGSYQRWGFPYNEDSSIIMPLNGIDSNIPLDKNQYRPFLNQLKNMNYKNHFIVSGDSNIFGHNLDNQQTISNVLRKQMELKGHKIYNISFPG